MRSTSPLSQGAALAVGRGRRRQVDAESRAAPAITVQAFQAPREVRDLRAGETSCAVSLGRQQADHFRIGRHVGTRRGGVGIAQREADGGDAGKFAGRGKGHLIRRLAGDTEIRLAAMNGPPLAPAIKSTLTAAPAATVALWAPATGIGLTLTVAGADTPKALARVKLKVTAAVPTLGGLVTAATVNGPPLVAWIVTGWPAWMVTLWATATGTASGVTLKATVAEVIGRRRVDHVEAADRGLAAC
jgi:hypothetical protein